MFLNIGCGKDIQPGYVNCDLRPGPGVDDVFDITQPWPYGEGTVDGIMANDVIEHVDDVLNLMSNAYYCIGPNGLFRIKLPHGASDDAWGDPDHRRPYFPESFGYFSQPFYWRADYGYAADWRVKDMVLAIQPDVFDKCDGVPEIMQYVHAWRNTVAQMQVTLQAVKPARAQDRDLMEPLTIAVGRAGVQA